MTRLSPAKANDDSANTITTICFMDHNRQMCDVVLRLVKQLKEAASDAHVPVDTPLSTAMSAVPEVMVCTEVEALIPAPQRALAEYVKAFPLTTTAPATLIAEVPLANSA